MIRRYRERGYAFAATTDHDVFAGYGTERGRAYVGCIPAAVPRFTALGPDCRPMHGDVGKPGVEYKEYELTGREKYVRAGVVRADGSRDWTNPVFF
jgi:hypothetical protein